MLSLPPENSAGYSSRTASTSFTKLEKILDNNAEGTKRMEEMLGPARPVRTGHKYLSIQASMYKTSALDSMICGEKSWTVSFPSYRILPKKKNIGYGLSTHDSSAQDRSGTNPSFAKHIVGSKRHEASCIYIRARNGTVEAAVGTEVGPSQTAARGDASKDSSTLLTATILRIVSTEAACAIAPCFMSF